MTKCQGNAYSCYKTKKPLISQVAGKKNCLKLHKRSKNFQGCLECKWTFFKTRVIIQNAAANPSKSTLLLYLNVINFR